MSLAKLVGGRILRYHGQKNLEYLEVTRGTLELEHGRVPEHIRRYHLSLPREISDKEVLFVDIETCGLSFNAPINTITVGKINGELSFRTFFAPDYFAEKAILIACLDYLRKADAVFTYNGTTFDIKRLSKRMQLHNIFRRTEKTNLGEMLGNKHYDLYPSMVKLLAEQNHALLDRKLQTLEKVLSKTHREEDIPGARIPEIYNAFIQGGKDIEERKKIEEDMAKVIEHNILDVASTCAVAAYAHENGVNIWENLLSPKVHISQ
ncbi:MAG: ribonuclease H-like domain-containing protein [Nanoarchaeota archaeon]